MKTCFYLVAFILGLAVTALGGELKSLQFDLGSHGRVAFEVPENWEVKFSKVTETNPPTFVARSSNDCTASISIFWEGLRGTTTNRTRAEMEQIAQGYAERLLIPGLGPQEFKFEPLTTKTVEGTFARLTVQRKNLTKKHFSNYTMGVARWGNYWCTFVFMTNEADGPGFQAALDVVKSLGRAGGKG